MQGARFANFIIDGSLIRIFSAGIGFVFGMALAASETAVNGGVTQESEMMFNIIGMLLGLAVVMSYYIISEACFQQTLAKSITGTKVVNVMGEKPSLGQIVGRSFARLIPFEAFSFLSTDPVGWHDSLSGSCVVKAR